MPLVWHILNTKLNQQGHSASTRKRLSVYLTALNALKERYEGVDRIMSHVRQVVTYLDARHNDRVVGDCLPAGVDRVDVLTCLPQFFLRTMITVQLALAQGRYPEEHELPPSLGSPAGTGTDSMCTCVSDDWDLPVLGDAFEAIMAAAPLDGGPKSSQAENTCPAGNVAHAPSTIDFDDFFNVSYDVYFGDSMA